MTPNGTENGGVGNGGMESDSLARALLRLRRLAPEAGGPTLGAVVATLGTRSLPLVMLLLAVVATVPSPGLPVGMVFGTVILVLAIQGLLLGGEPRLPDRFARWRLPTRLLEAVLRRMVPLLRRVERHLKPRLPWLTRGAGRLGAGLMIALQGFLMAVPIPFGNTAPGIVIAVIALGLLRRDGLALIIGHALGLLAVAVLIALTLGAYHLLAWMGHLFGL